MLQRLTGLLPEISFLRKLSALVGGTLAGQALVILVSPLLTRLFTPEEFGVFAVFAALAGILGASATLRFEYAVPVAANDEDAAALVMVAIVATGLTAALQTLLIWYFGARLATAVEAPALAGWLWLLPPASLTWGFGSALAHWSIRRNTYAVNGLNRTLHLGSQASGQVVFGLLGTGGPGLIVGYLVGYVVRVGHYLGSLRVGERRLLRSQPPAALWRRACESWRYPAFAFPSGLLHNSAELVPVFLVAALYGTSVAGLYALGQRVMSLPMQMLSQVASQVFLGELRGLDPAAIHRLFLRTIALFTGLGLLGMVPLLLFAPALFAIVFGETWRESGSIVQLLVPLYLVRFIVQPISQLLYAFGRQAIHLLSAGLAMLALLASFGAGHALDLDAHLTILLYSLTSSATFLLYLWISWAMARQQRVEVGVAAEI